VFLAVVAALPLDSVERYHDVRLLFRRTRPVSKSWALEKREVRGERSEMINVASSSFFIIVVVLCNLTAKIQKKRE
jgi:hypothetical protein